MDVNRKVAPVSASTVKKEKQKETTTPASASSRVNILQATLEDCFSKCICIKSSAETLNTMMELPVSRTLYAVIISKSISFMSPDTRPSFDEIDAMLVIARVAIMLKLYTLYDKFIHACHPLFLETYMNNSEKTPFVIRNLTKNGRHAICKYLCQFIHSTKRNIWMERHGNSFLCMN